MKKEVELFQAVYHYFDEKGYEIRAEVNDCDVVCIKNDELVIVELKLKWCMNLLYQISDRARFTRDVYIALPKKEINTSNKIGKKKLHLLRCLEVGLLLVSKDDEGYIIEEVLNPKKMDKKILINRNKRKISNIKEEFYGREKLSNVGGSVKVPINTAYKELSLKILQVLGEKELKLKDIRKELNDHKKINGIVQNNYYGWFERVDRGIYKATESGLSITKEKRE